MKFETHSHSHHSKGRKLPVEGLPSPKEIIRTAKAKGLSGIVLCDHDSNSGWKEASAEAKKQGIIFIPGIEITTKSGHVVGMGLNDYIPPGLSVEETVNRIHWQGGIAVSSHPYDIKKEGIREECKHVDAIEEFNSLNFDRFSNRKAKKVAQKLGKPTLAASDAHSLDMIASSYNTIPDAHDIDSFLREVRAGHVRVTTGYIPAHVLMDWARERLARSHQAALQHINRNYNPAKRWLATRMLRGYVTNHKKLRYRALTKLGLGTARIIGAVKFAKGY